MVTPKAKLVTPKAKLVTPNAESSGAVQERLGLSAEQTEAVRQLFDQARATRKKQREAMHEAVAQILTAPQLEKFKALRAERKAAHEAEHAKRKAERAAAP